MVRDPFYESPLAVHVTTIVTSEWDDVFVRTSRVGAAGEVLGYRVTDSVGTIAASETFPAALVSHAELAAAFGEAAADMAARNFWARESLQMRIAADH